MTERINILIALSIILVSSFVNVISFNAQTPALDELKRRYDDLAAKAIKARATSNVLGEVAEKVQPYLEIATLDEKKYINEILTLCLEEKDKADLLDKQHKRIQDEDINPEVDKLKVSKDSIAIETFIRWVNLNNLRDKKTYYTVRKEVAEQLINKHPANISQSVVTP